MCIASGNPSHIRLANLQVRALATSQPHATVAAVPRLRAAVFLLRTDKQRAVREAAARAAAALQRLNHTEGAQGGNPAAARHGGYHARELFRQQLARDRALRAAADKPATDEPSARPLSPRWCVRPEQQQTSPVRGMNPLRSSVSPLRSRMSSPWCSPREARSQMSPVEATNDAHQASLSACGESGLGAYGTKRGESEGDRYALGGSYAIAHARKCSPRRLWGNGRHKSPLSARWPAEAAAARNAVDDEDAHSHEGAGDAGGDDEACQLGDARAGMRAHERTDMGAHARTDVGAHARTDLGAHTRAHAGFEEHPADDAHFERIDPDGNEDNGDGDDARGAFNLVPPSNAATTCHATDSELGLDYGMIDDEEAVLAARVRHTLGREPPSTARHADDGCSFGASILPASFGASVPAAFGSFNASSPRVHVAASTLRVARAAAATARAATASETRRRVQLERQLRVAQATAEHERIRGEDAHEAARDAAEAARAAAATSKAELANAEEQLAATRRQRESERHQLEVVRTELTSSLRELDSTSVEMHHLRSIVDDTRSRLQVRERELSEVEARAATEQAVAVATAVTAAIATERVASDAEAVARIASAAATHAEQLQRERSRSALASIAARKAAADAAECDEAAARAQADAARGEDEAARGRAEAHACVGALIEAETDTAQATTTSKGLAVRLVVAESRAAAAEAEGAAHATVFAESCRAWDAEEREAVARAEATRARISQMEKCVRDGESIISELEQRLADCAAESDASRARHDEAIQHKQGLLADKESLLRDKQDLISEKENLISEKHLLISQNENLLVEMATLGSANEMLRREHQKLVSRKEAANTERAALALAQSVSCSQLTAELNASEGDLDISRENLEACRKEVAASEHQLEICRSLLAVEREKRALAEAATEISESRHAFEVAEAAAAREAAAAARADATEVRATAAEATAAQAAAQAVVAHATAARHPSALTPHGAPMLSTRLARAKAAYSPSSAKGSYRPTSATARASTPRTALPVQHFEMQFGLGHRSSPRSSSRSSIGLGTLEAGNATEKGDADLGAAALRVRRRRSVSESPLSKGSGNALEACACEHISHRGRG